MNSWTKSTRQRVALLLSSCHLLLPCCSTLPHCKYFLFPLPWSLFSFRCWFLLSQNTPFSPFFTIFLRISVFLLALFHSFPLLSIVQIFLCSLSFPVLSFPSCLSHSPCYFLITLDFFVCVFCPFSFNSVWSNLDDFIRPFLSVRQETTSIFLGVMTHSHTRAQAAWLRMHAHTHTHNMPSHPSFPLHSALFTPLPSTQLPKSAHYLKNSIHH